MWANRLGKTDITVEEVAGEAPLPTNRAAPPTVSDRSISFSKSAMSSGFHPRRSARYRTGL
jgi:hypothetical protein